MAALRKLGRNFWIGVLLIAVNLFALAQILTMPTKPPHVVDPIRDPEVEQLLSYINSGKHSGESWQVTLTDLQAEQTITWYLNKYPQIPFAYPQVQITPDYISGEGDVTVAGVRSHVAAKVKVTLKDGLPVVKILSMNLPPVLQWAQDPVEQAIQSQLQRAADLPVRFTSAEWSNGVVVVKGTIR